MDNEISEAAAQRIARAIKAGVAANVGDNMRCSIGLAPNCYLAKVAADLQKPDGLTMLRAADLPGRLLGLNLGDLPGVGRNMERRLQAAGVHDMAALWALEPRRMREIWGSLWGPRMWQLLRGEDLPEIETQRRSVGHSHVMAPELRDPAEAILVARRLLLKAVSRLRRMEHYATALSFSARLENGARVHAEARCRPAQDSMSFLRLLDGMWREHIAPLNARVKKTGVVLHGLVPAGAIQPDLLEVVNMEQMRDEKLSRAMDTLNRRFGRDTILLGMSQKQAKRYTGPKIAFNRIPDRMEFVE
jgi:DNA polymerase-4